MKEAEKDINTQINTFYGNILKGLKYKVVLKFNSDFVEVVKSEVKKQKASAVIVGRSKTSYIERMIFGNHFSRLIGQISVPIIVILEGNKSKSVKKIACPVKIDGAIKKKQIRIIKTFAELFSAQINLIHITPYIRNKADKDYLWRALQALAKKISYADVSLSLVENDFPEIGLHDHLLHKSVQLLAIIFHKHTFLEKLFAPNNVRNIAMAIEKPLLIIPE